MTHLLLMYRSRANEAKYLVARHVDPSWLKQRGYEIARSLGNHGALWQRTGACASMRTRFALDIDSDACLTIERQSKETAAADVKKPALRLAFSGATETSLALSEPGSTPPAWSPRQR
ncbi:hypothetical protein [Cognatazoarcus halotolerans]|uniref:hypothetical protein n=1 Tax=Cognatazoarcus halotolerans TaxID=2686016 RepID=UPI0013574A99|nr:hypothetical protein [Cognatazoarcus halotolerans]MBX3680795.1 hypothetical protein [Rhodocyclaceae bacterium]MCB1898029.1 hypothetical protein [Rhodocyclaceae bacterium]MCP5308265.1 hypothetical protein [Zoogloeaceae bacterium]